LDLAELAPDLAVVAVIGAAFAVWFSTGARRAMAAVVDRRLLAFGPTVLALVVAATAFGLGAGHGLGLWLGVGTQVLGIAVVVLLGSAHGSTEPVVKLVNLLLVSAVKQQAEELRIAPNGAVTIVKGGARLSLFDPVPVEGAAAAPVHLPKKLVNPVVLRLEHMAGITPSGSGPTRGQGRFQVIIGDRPPQTFVVRSEAATGDELYAIVSLKDEELLDDSSLG